MFLLKKILYMPDSVKRLFKFVLTLFLVSTSFTAISPAYSKTIHLPPVIPIRPLPVRNIEFSPDGKFMAVPNLITAGSIGIFTVSQESKISSLPSRVSERDFYRVAGVSYFANKKKNAPPLVYLNLPELMSGYTVAFSPGGEELAVTGGDKILMYSTKDWKQSRSITMGRNANRCVFSPDSKHIAALADGKIYIIETSMYTVRATIEPATNHLFADMTFNGDGSIVATLEYRNIIMDHVPRVRLFSTINGDIERELPYFEEKLDDSPGKHYPLISFTPADSALIVTFERPFKGKTVIIKSNDGSRIRELKGSHHNISPDKSMLAAGGVIYDIATWNSIGTYKSGTLCCSFSPTDHTIATVATETLRRYKIEK